MDHPWEAIRTVLSNPEVFVHDILDGDILETRSTYIELEIERGIFSTFGRGRRLPGNEGVRWIVESYEPKGVLTFTFSQSQDLLLMVLERDGFSGIFAGKYIKDRLRRVEKDINEIIKKRRILMRI